MPGTAFRFADWNGIISDGFVACLPRLDEILGGGEVVVDKPDRVVRKVNVDGRTLYSKCFLPKTRLSDRVKEAVRRPLVFRLWSVHSGMLSQGIGCPEPLLAAFGKGGAAYFLCREVPFATCRMLLKSVPENGISDVFSKAAKGIAMLHRAGFIHGDCLPGNICIDNGGRAFFIDNDRTSRMIPFVGRHAMMRNLVQFCAHSTCRDFIGNGHFTEFYVEYTRWHSGRTPSVKEVSSFVSRVDSRIDEIREQKAAAKAGGTAS